MTQSPSRIDEVSRWDEIQALSRKVASKGGAPTEIESALCGAVLRARDAMKEADDLRDVVESLRAALPEQIAFFKGLMSGWPGMARAEDRKMMESILKVLAARSETQPTLRSLAERCRPAVEHYMRTEERASRSENLGEGTKKIAAGYALQMGELLDEIDAILHDVPVKQGGDKNSIPKAAPPASPSVAPADSESGSAAGPAGAARDRGDFEGRCDDVRVRLSDTEHGTALTIEFWETDVLPDEPRAASTVYLDAKTENDMRAWLNNSAPSATRQTYSDKFLLEVCEELFGCFLHHHGGGQYICAICEAEIEMKNWVHAEHNPGCVITEVRRYLVEHKPLCVPPRNSSEGTEAIPEHVCGLQGFNPAIDPPCPACKRFRTDRTADSQG